MIAPTLIVGLGGTGSKIVQKVYALATPAQRKNLSFVVFDTDINELRGITEATPAIRTVQTSAKMSVGEYLDIDKFARDTWFPVNKIMNRKALTEGAGQVRAISRLALNTAIQQGRMTPLEDAIKELYIMSGDRANQALRVMLVGSLCGGTGSGLLLPVSLYIRNFLKTKMQQGSAVIRGFFILPEVFHKVITSKTERSNLACNAYAAIREIDSFFMKGDGSLPESYDLHYMVPRPGSKEQDDMADSPMDFCFLYDAQNMDAQQLWNFGDYLDHAANCIYAQSIAPTSKRSNSSEDNVIGDVIREGGRNRYCGAGSSLVEYPLEDVKKYLTLIWARDNISSEWLDVDRDYKSQQKQYLQKKRDGINVAPVDRIAHYMSTVEMGHKERKSFLSSVRNMCYSFKPNGFVEEAPYWYNFQSALDDYINDQVLETREDPDVAEIIESCIALQKAVANPPKNGASSLSKKFDNWYSSLLEFKQATIKYTESLGERLAYTLYRDEADFTETDQTYRLEYWMRQPSGDTLFHPNAMRYFLCNVLKQLEKKRSELKGAAMVGASGDTDGGVGNTKESVEEYWKRFEVNAFDDSETEDKIETASEHYKKTHLDEKDKLRQLFYRSTIEAAKDELESKMGEYFSKTMSYWTINVSCIVYDSAIHYIREMLSSFDAFYDVLEKKVGSLAKDIDELETKYVVDDAEKDGKTVRYVCANKACLKALSEDVVNLGSSLDIPKELTKLIYNKVRRYAMAQDKPKTERYFADTYENAILGYYTKSILDNYESTVCMDVLTAIGYEAKTIAYADQDMSDAERITYMTAVLDAAKHRARPFISAPADKGNRIIDACTYSKKLAEAEEPGRKNFVSKQLGDFGGVADYDIDPNRIVFFRSIYSLKAKELDKFKPPVLAETTEKPSGGEYYNAYFERIERLHPDPRKSLAITPHIDRWWHVINKLPDLDEDHQDKLEYDIDAAFFWGLMNGAVTYEKDGKFANIYKINVDRFEGFNSEDAELIVSNGTACDNFYELLDAIRIYPKLVKEILNEVDNRINQDLNRQIPKTETYLYKLLNSFRVSEFKLAAQVAEEAAQEAKEKEEANELGLALTIKTNKADQPKAGLRSILEIPLLMKRSVPAEMYYEEVVIKLLNTELEEVKKYLHKFCDKLDYQEKYGEIINSQFELFMKNVTEEDADRGDIVRDPLFNRICNVVAKELEALYQGDKADEIREMLKRKALR